MYIHYASDDLFIATSLQLLLPVIQKKIISAPRFSIRRKKNPQKLNVFFLNTHLVNFKFVLRNYCFTVFAIYFVDRIYEVNSWIDIGIMFDISDIYFLSRNFHNKIDRENNEKQFLRQI
jgi:hypothetical protein